MMAKRKAKTEPAPAPAGIMKEWTDTRNLLVCIPEIEQIQANRELINARAEMKVAEDELHEVVTWFKHQVTGIKSRVAALEQVVGTGRRPGKVEVRYQMRKARPGEAPTGAGYGPGDTFEDDAIVVVETRTDTDEVILVREANWGERQDEIDFEEDDDLANDETEE
jgi:hypothetical protein